MTTPTILYRLLGSAALIATLTACATAPADPAIAASSKMQDMLAKASEASSGGRNEQALALWRATTTAFPADKTAWGLIAKAKFDAAQYGEAVVNAEEVLVRDPNDTQANSIIATSGLRLATRALASLSRQNGFSGSLQKESMELARVLRESIGNEVLFSTAQQDKNNPRGGDAKARVRSFDNAKPKAKADDCKAGDPFCALK